MGYRRLVRWFPEFVIKKPFDKSGEPKQRCLNQKTTATIALISFQIVI